MSRENSALIALNELKNLEAQRVQKVEDDHRSKQDAERSRVEEAERKRREEAERVHREQEERMRREQEEREQREREERIRVAETEARARAEQEARLREEQMRLDAQVKMAERKKTPYWLYATAGVLAIGLAVGGYFLWQKKQEGDAAAAQKVLDDKKAEVAAAQKIIDDKKYADDLAAKQKEIDDLEAEKAKLEKQQADIAKELETATGARRDELLAEAATVTKKLGANKKKSGSSAAESKPGATKERKDSIKLGGGDNPLGDL